MTDYLADVKKYDAGANPDVVNKIVKHLGIALRNRDSSLVSATDQKELDRVRDNWGVKKLGVDAAKAEAAVAATAKDLAADRTKSRVTFYYLVAKHLGKLETI
jgi:energy-coupling factor transporter ATP-binding protein EcfA2